MRPCERLESRRLCGRQNIRDCASAIPKYFCVDLDMLQAFPVNFRVDRVAEQASTGSCGRPERKCIAFRVPAVMSGAVRCWWMQCRRTAGDQREDQELVHWSSLTVARALHCQIRPSLPRQIDSRVPGFSLIGSNECVPPTSSLADRPVC